MYTLSQDSRRAFMSLHEHEEDRGQERDQQIQRKHSTWLVTEAP